MDLESIYAKHHASLFRYAQRLVGDADVAADVSQEAFVRLMEQSVAPEKVKSWLFTVTTNLVRDRARTKDRHRRLLRRPAAKPDPPESLEKRAERTERVAAVRAALEQLAPRDRKILLMREEGFRYAEIAEVIGVAESSVGTLLARALKRFEKVYRADAGRLAGAPAEPSAGRREAG